MQPQFSPFPYCPTLSMPRAIKGTSSLHWAAALLAIKGFTPLVAKTQSRPKSSPPEFNLLPSVSPAVHEPQFCLQR